MLSGAHQRAAAPERDCCLNMARLVRDPARVRRHRRYGA